MVAYSVCITHRNNSSTLEASLESVLSQLNGDFEVIVVDSQSNDGSLEKLRGYSDKGRIKLIIKRCSRGMGRQIALENAKGDYIISNLDMDDIYRPRLDELLRFYHAKCEGSVLLSVFDSASDKISFQNVTVTPRETAVDIGGWHDLQYGEDWEFWARAAKKDEYAWTSFPLIVEPNRHNERIGRVAKARFRLIRYRDAIRSGRVVFRSDDRTSTYQKAFYLLAKTVAPFYSSYADPFNRTFDAHAARYYVE